MYEVIQVKLREAGKITYFSTGGMRFKIGDHVIVEGDRGLDYGQVLSEREAEGYRPLLEALGVQDLYLNGENLLYSYEAFLQRHNLAHEECAYIGDDIGDIGVLSKVGLPATAIDGADYLRNRVGYISGYEGGKGCVRELIEMILIKQGKWPYIERGAEEE